MRFLKSALMVLGLAGAGAAQAAPSFDCTAAGTGIERLICADDYLSRLDSEMAELYANARELSDRPDQITNAQRLFVRNRNRTCRLTGDEERSPVRRRDTVECLRGVYQERINVLRRAAPEPLRVWGGPEIDPNRAVPEVCLSFNASIRAPGNASLDAFFEIEPGAPLAVVGQGNRVCMTGFTRGQSYTLTMLDGLESDDGRRMRRGADFDVVVPDREPALRVAAQGRILPRTGSGGLPFEAVNVARVEARILRVDAPDILDAIRSGDALDYGAPDALTARLGGVAWSGEMTLDAGLNEAARQTLPIGEMVTTLEPGVYIAALTGEGLEGVEPGNRWDDRGEQMASTAVDPAFFWFTISDLGLTAWRGDDGLTAQARSATDGAPLDGVTVTLYSVGNEALAAAETGADGVARIAAGFLRGEGRDAPLRLHAAGPEGDFVSLDLARAPLDLTDRGVAGRAAPGVLDAFLTAERGIYRPGETVNLTGILRDDAARAVTGVPLMLTLYRPDGVTALTRVLEDRGAGGYTARLDTPPNAMTGRWRAVLTAGEDDTPVGSTRFLIEDFVPPRIEVALDAAQDAVAPEASATLRLQADFLYGAPAGGLAGTVEAVIDAPPAPFAGFADYRFGLADDPAPAPVRASGESFETGPDGAALVEAFVGAVPDSTHPLRATFSALVYDVGGRPVSRSLTLPVDTGRTYIGIAPAFEHGTAPAEGPAGFSAIAVDGTGARLARAGLEWRVVRERVDHIWYRRGGRWQSESLRSDVETVASGAFDITADAPARFEADLPDWAPYRVEIAGKGTVLASWRFYRGWRSPGQGEEVAPDIVTVTPPEGAFAPGQTVRVFVQPPFDAEVSVAVADASVRSVTNHSVPASGAEIEITLPDGPVAGTYLLVSAHGAPDPLRRQAPLRAVGVAWLPYDASAQTLAATLEAPELARPGTPMTVTLDLADLPDGPVFATLAAVDDGVLQLTGFTAPDPAGYYFGQRQLGVRMHDVWGSFIDAAGWRMGEVRSGGDEADRMSAAPGSDQMSSLPKKTKEIAAWFSGVMPIENGRAEITFEAPDFDGRLRLMAVLWGADGVGHAETTALVRAPLVAELSLPRFLAPGDEARALVTLHNLDAPIGAYTASVIADGPVSVRRAGATMTLPAGARASAPVLLTAQDRLGDAALTLTVQGPQGYRSVRDYTLSVRSGNGFETRRSIVELQPGDSLTPDRSVIEPYYERAARLTVGVNPVPALDIPSILDGLNHYPYGCAEQTASTATPLLLADALSEHYRMHGAEPPEEAIPGAIGRLTAMQSPFGGFGAWSARGYGTPWLTGYVMDFLLEAKAKGFDVPDASLRRGIERLTDLAEQPAGVDDDSLSARAYAWSLLAREGAADPARLRRFHAVRFAHLPDGAAKAHAAYAMAKIGDVQAAFIGFLEASVTIDKADGEGRWQDYGSALRDRALLVTLMVESGAIDWRVIMQEAEKLSAAVTASSWLSTQEQAWVLRAGHAMLTAPRPPVEIMLNDQPLVLTGGPLMREATAGALPSIRNASDQPVYGLISWGGIPRGTVRAESNGFTIERQLFTRDGEPVEPEALRQNDLVVVVLDVLMTEPGRARALAVDFLPAGLEPENPATGGEALAGLPWLSGIGAVEHVELRDDRFIAAANIDAQPERPGSFRAAYIARAVTPGRYAYPGAYVEDMYAPDRFARGTPVTARVAE